MSIFPQLPSSHTLHTMTTIPNPTTAFHHHIATVHHRRHHHPTIQRIQATTFSELQANRRKFVTTILSSTSLALGLHLHATPLAQAQNWGTRSFLLEKFFQPGLSPEDAVARIRQTAEGLHELRGMLETMSWRYVIFYIRLKQSYLSQDMRTAMTILPDNRKKSYVKIANELVDNMSEFDRYVRSPKVYESYLYYEKTLKSMDDLVAILA
ncbi:photosynthetic NDH subunit of lumenal location 2, chloroplastic [Henckelia pumila]|uniref:photosynthetic NDH subunit of lumenal location 2, chloroplastic n=1 Tax=Henckelia pumila TaxID=405737 RepID=UPI003C6E0158